MSGKYDSARDELIHDLSTQGWEEDSTGDAEAPCGFVSIMKLTADDFSNAYLQKTQAVFGVAPLDLLGSWTVGINSDGFVTVRKYDSHDLAREAFEKVEAEYAKWQEAEEA